MKAIIQVWPKKEVLDPQGNAIMKTLHTMNYTEIANLRQGKIFELEINQTDETIVKKKLEEICKTLLANEIIENYKINLNK